MIARKMWGVARIDSKYPIAIHETKEQAMKALDREYVLLVEMEVTKVSKMCIHFCECESKCHCQ